MKTVKYKVSLKGLPTPSGSISFCALRKTIEVIHDGAERALRLSLEGASKKTGPVPNWLSRSTDFILTGIGSGSTTLVFEAPLLGEVAAAQIHQPDLWNLVPAPEDTALTILSKSVTDAMQHKLDSDRYDGGVLETLLEFRHLLDKDGVRVQLSAARRRKENFCLDPKSFRAFEKLKSETPEPQTVIVTGFFNMIQHSDRQFELTLESGQTVRGKLEEKMIPVEQMRNLWGKKVTIKGVLYFNASKKPRLLEAHTISTAVKEDQVFETIPLPIPSTDLVQHIAEQSSRRNVVSEIWGEWPGDETTEEILNALRES